MSLYACEELINEIFSRLPAKFLLRSRSVSKLLYAQIGSPYFVQLHKIRSPKKILIIHRIQHNDVKYTIHSEDQLSSYTGIAPVKYPFGSRSSIVGSCNGILCVYEPGAIHLWNPSIRRKVTAHVVPSWDAYLACGFGFDSNSKDYKIVIILKEATFVYTMKTSAWRKVASPETQVDSVSGSQCLFNEKLHWVVRGYTTVPDIDYYCILTFDLISEVFSTIELLDPSLQVCEVTIINGCLAVMCPKDDDDGFIWRRKTAVSWDVAFEVDVHQCITHGNLLFSYGHPGIDVYNPETEERSKFPPLTGSRIQSMTTCIETLELLDMGTSFGVIEESKLQESELNQKC